MLATKIVWTGVEANSRRRRWVHHCLTSFHRITLLLLAVFVPSPWRQAGSVDGAAVVPSFLVRRDPSCRVRELSFRCPAEQLSWLYY